MEHFRSLTSLSQSILQIPFKTRATVLGVTASLALISILAALLKRRKRKCANDKRKRYLELQRERERTGRLPVSHSPNGELPYRSRSPSSIRSLLKQKSLSGSTASLGAASTSTTSTIIHPSAVDTTDMSPPQLCQLGLDTLQLAVTYWEDAVMRLGYLDDSPVPAITDPETAALQHHLEHLLEMAYHMQDTYERQVERHADQLVFDTALMAFTETESARLSTKATSIDSSSDVDSFVSATDLADLSDLDTHRDMFKHLVLYEAGLMELKHGTVTCRTLRSEMAHCLSDTEFLAKLHCLRLALEDVFKITANRDYFIDMGKKIIGELLVQADKDPEDFYTSYSSMMEFISNPDHLSMMEEELRGRGVKCLTFYDVVLDFILMDAFDDLENLPSTVRAVANNRWLSNSFKETALSTAVWSVLKAKRQNLKFSDGFIAHFYAISESVSPVLAWGFLGPQSRLTDLCQYFKDIVLGFIRDMFSFEKVRYTTLDALSEDVLKIGKSRTEEVLQKLTSSPT